ncbi:E3 ubiquitin ligase PARAQUAT TOLERANCE 3-like [Aristolochia californica]|uniref:E3 ubiquitin ligase PARAQUAT TOLERANCE 3-like n=1 Tax=Aristolochia californica TaxID=171875 RepID=UPI0035D82D08
MVVLFKFRSSVNFDSVGIDGQPFISVRDLRAKIRLQKGLKICHDFDLVISDANTGEAFEDENYSICDGSSVIIKRVPAGTSALPSAVPCINSTEKTADFVINTMSFAANIDMENFDDFGVDLYPAPEASVFDSCPDNHKVDCIFKKNADDIVQRSSETSIVWCQNCEQMDTSEAVPRGNTKCNVADDNGVKLQEDCDAMTEEQNREVGSSSPTFVNTEVPAELRCSLCNTIFKEAVMIPCCQHSFCNKCIRFELAEKKKCPKCSSAKCRVDDLLPNVSLRQAIEHFFESQIHISGSDKILPKYAPDGESGVQAIGLSCAMSTLKREPSFPQSPTGTGKGSNQIMPETGCQSRLRNKQVIGGAGTTLKSAASLHKIDERGGESDAAAKSSTGPQKVPQRLVQDEVNKSKKGLWANPTDGSGTFIGTSRSRRGDRTCYMCGSPDHFVRDCPAASSPYTMFQTGTGEIMYPRGTSAYGMPCWQGVRPFGGLFGAQGMMPFDSAMVPISHFSVPPYMQSMSMYAGMPLHSGYVSMRGIVPAMAAGAGYPHNHASDRRHSSIRTHPERKHSGEYDDLMNDPCFSESQRQSCDNKYHSEHEDTQSYSGDDDNKRYQKKHCRDKHSESTFHQKGGYVSDVAYSLGYKHEKGSQFSASSREYGSHYHKRSSGVNEICHASDSSDYHSMGRVKSHRRSSNSPNWRSSNPPHRRTNHHQRSSNSPHRRSSNHHRRSSNSPHQRSSRKQYEETHHRSPKGISGTQKRCKADIKEHKRKHYSQSGTGVEPCSSGDKKRQVKEKEASQSSKNKIEITDYDRWEMADGLNVNQREEYHYHSKHKRNH